MSRPTDRLPHTPPGEQHTAGGAPQERRRLWPAVATVAALGLALAFVWSNPKDAEQQREQRATERKAAERDRKSIVESGLISVGKAKADIRAEWRWEEDRVTITLNPDPSGPSNYVSISAQEQEDSQEAMPMVPLPFAVTVTLPIEDPPQAITVRVALGDEDWKKGDAAPSRLLRLSPEGTLTDVTTGKELPTEFS
ncbi:hypothetical protein LXH09_37120 [Streptomyces sp. CS7]|uniref:hypothetical protein n=1 Tax=Streptomyces sp. CS-7 TaxID=2906769 RepID=UPI0021B23CA4|nr:hypothetical protein [Streptomyces sp. CS-7]MCT6782246.1 hypothetical protein [Streptomyces sp. CS-7]